jgi:predicted transcriptional regulator
MDKCLQHCCKIAPLMTNDIKNKLLETMKVRGVNIPSFSKQTGIPKDRIYKWYQQGTNIKPQDIMTVEKWINEGEQPKNGDKYKFQADTNKLVSEMIEQIVAVTATQNILKPIIYELYAAHRNEMMTKVVNELDNLIGFEAKRLLDLIQQKWNLK